MYKKSVSILSVILILCGLIGCNTTSTKEILRENVVASIQLECAQLCKQKGEVPFSVKTFENEQEIELFVEAINKAEKMEGILDYGALFLMKVIFKDGTQMHYVLNIEKEFGTKGLLVETSDSSQGYTISQELSYELSKIIYTQSI